MTGIFFAGLEKNYWLAMAEFDEKMGSDRASEV
jgi:hypothetical protein